MAVPCVRLALLLCLMILPATVASPRSLRRRRSRANTSASRPTTFFEVDRPLRPPRGSSGRCSTLLLSASFGSTFASPPAAAYSPPRCLVRAGGRASAISLAVLEWRAACRGAQLGRIFGVWLGGAEILRGRAAAAERCRLVRLQGRHQVRVPPRRRRQVQLHPHRVPRQPRQHRRLPCQRHAPPLPPPHVDDSEAAARRHGSRRPHRPDVAASERRAVVLDPERRRPRVALPPNTYRAVLELYVSSHEDDELWYTKQPGYQNGPFREVTARVDGVLAGAMCPFPVIYAGGIYPLLWRPITPIGSFNLPTYDIELTPFLGKLLDGKPHEFALAVTNAVGVWYVDANLHLWLDPGSTATAAGLVSYVAPPVNTTSSKSADPVDTHYHATANRLVSATGWVRSSYGNIMTNATRAFAIEYLLTFETLDLTVVADTCVVATDHAGVVLYSAQTHGNFPLGWVYQQNSLAVTHGLEETTVATGRWSPGPPYRSLRTTQSSLVEDEEGGGKSWGVRQTYWYKATDGCYFRNVTSSNYSVVSDHSNEVCVKGTASAPLPPL